ncbi:hypothetical protein T484DRAFT_1817481 [Baffinella frigidus]|nr:hypothetical protein T484DRAFT_1817481 [Cryptophyta sp. CCMP2293]
MSPERREVARSGSSPGGWRAGTSPPPDEAGWQGLVRAADASTVEDVHEDDDTPGEAAQHLLACSA